MGGSGNVLEGVPLLGRASSALEGGVCEWTAKLSHSGICSKAKGTSESTKPGGGRRQKWAQGKPGQLDRNEVFI